LDDYKLEIDHFCNSSLSELQDLDKLKGKELRIAGIVTLVEHKTTKTNKPFGKLTIEDFTDSLNLMFFSQDYMQFKSYMQEGYTLFLKGKVESRKYNEDELEFKISEIHLLSDIKDTLIKSIQLRIAAKDITPDFLNDFTGMVNANKGNTTLRLMIFDSKEKIWVEMFSRSNRVELNKKFVAYLDHNPAIEYKIE